MITDRTAYRALCEEERWEILRAMSSEDSIAVGEAPLTSEVMALATFGDRPRPVSLAYALGIPRPQPPTE